MYLSEWEPTELNSSFSLMIIGDNDDNNNST